jgi:hypothetical protein
MCVGSLKQLVCSRKVSSLSATAVECFDIYGILLCVVTKMEDEPPLQRRRMVGNRIVVGNPDEEDEEDDNLSTGSNPDEEIDEAVNEEDDGEDLADNWIE